MVSLQGSILRRTLPLATYNQLRLVFGQMAAKVAKDGLLLTEDVVSGVEITPEILPCRFLVLVSGRFNALLLGEAIEPVTPGWQDPQTTKYQVGLSFEPDAIASFLTQLSSILKNRPVFHQALEQASLSLKPNDASLQSEFTLAMLEALAFDGNDNQASQTIYPSVSVCQPIHDALSQQVEQERLLNQVTTQIRQSLKLPAILKTAVEQVRSFLKADRLVIYQFEDSETQKDNSKSKNVGWGSVTYEAKLSDDIPSVLNLTQADRCFVNVPNYREKYRKGFTLALEDAATAYSFSNCMLQFMQKTHIRAKLVVPIVVQEKLWGLLIAHQCFEPRQWLENEKIFLQHIAENLAIAIHQAQLYAQLQQQKQTLEQRVIERTQELQDALLAAESASRSRSEFLAMMSHELRTPLTCVIGLSATLLRWSFGDLTQKQRDYLQIIHDNGQHLLELINDILDLSQAEAGKTILNIREFSLSKLANQCLKTFREKALKQELDLRINLQIPPHKDRFRADPKRVRQILLNLLSNAVKFTPAEGTVVMRVWLEKKTAVFQVADTGIGIPEHQHHLIFKKFQQLDTSRHRQYEGTGLGLALTKQLVELHNGRIEFESTVDVGSTFTVWIPSQPLTSVSNSASHTSSLTPHPEGRIALINSNEESAILICNILTAAGYQVVWILEGSTAFKQTEILQPAIIIVDSQLSGMNGYELMRQLRRSKTTRDMRIIGLIPTETKEHLTNLLLERVDDYLVQPLTPEALLNKVAALMVNSIPATCVVQVDEL